MDYEPAVSFVGESPLALLDVVAFADRRVSKALRDIILNSPLTTMPDIYSFWSKIWMADFQTRMHP